MLFRILFQILFPIYISLRLVGPQEACFTPFSRTGTLAACLLLFSRAGPSHQSSCISVIMDIRYCDHPLFRTAKPPASYRPAALNLTNSFSCLHMLLIIDCSAIRTPAAQHTLCMLFVFVILRFLKMPLGRDYPVAYRFCPAFYPTSAISSCIAIPFLLHTCILICM